MNEVKQPEPPKLRWTDRVIGFFSPGMAARRIGQRHMLEFMARQDFSAHRGASTTPTKGVNWLGSKLSPDSIAEEELETLRDRSRDLYRNEPTVAGFVASRVARVVGTGFRPQARIQAVSSLITEAQAETWNLELEELYKRLAPYLDFNGILTEAEIMQQLERCWTKDGDVFVRFRAYVHVDKPIPFAIEVIPSDRVGTPAGMEGDRNVRLGIRYDAQGRRVGYYVLKFAPGDTRNISTDYEYVPAIDPQSGFPNMVHLFDQIEPGQSRGLPAISCVLDLLKMLQELREAIGVRERIRACFVAFIKTVNPFASAMANATDYAPTASTHGGYRIQGVSPGRVEYLGDNEEPTFANPGTGGSEYSPFTEWIKLDIAAALNWPYSWLTKDYRKSTYSSERCALIDGTNVVQCRQAMHISRLWCYVWMHILRQGVATGEVSITNRFYRDNKHLLEGHDWIPQAVPWIDPLKDGQAAKLAVDENFDTRANIIASRGLDPERVQQTRSNEKKWDQQWGITTKDQQPPQQPTPDAEDEANAEETQGVAA